MKRGKYSKVHFPSFQNKLTETCYSQQNCITIHLPTSSDSAASVSRGDTVVIQSSGGWRSLWSWRYVPYVMCDGMPTNKGNSVHMLVDDIHKNYSRIYKINRMLQNGRQLSHGWKLHKIFMFVILHTEFKLVENCCTELFISYFLIWPVKVLNN